MSDNVLLFRKISRSREAREELRRAADRAAAKAARDTYDAVRDASAHIAGAFVVAGLLVAGRIRFVSGKLVAEKFASIATNTAAYFKNEADTVRANGFPAVAADIAKTADEWVRVAHELGETGKS